MVFKRKVYKGSDVKMQKARKVMASASSPATPRQIAMRKRQSERMQAQSKKMAKKGY